MSKSAAHLLQAARYRPWAIYKPALGAVLEQLRLRTEAIAKMSAIEIDAAVAAAGSAPLGRMIGSTAVIPVCGVITQKSDFYSWWYGGTSVERLTASFRTYLNDPAVSTIVFDVDSPGGEVFGVPEFFEEVFAARGQKTLVSVSNPFMASAAYWIGCACDEVYLLPSGQAGSVGCYTMHEDLSKMLEEIGVAVTFIQYGEHKTEGNPYEPLADSAREELQASVDHYGSWFDKAVAKARGITTADVKAKFGQGRVLRAPDAKKVGMVDKVATLDQVLARFAPKRGRGMASAEATHASDEALAAMAAGATLDGNEGDTFRPIVAKKAETIEPNEDSAAAQVQADQDAIDVTLALTD